MAIIRGTNGRNRLKGTASKDTLLGLGGNDILDGRKGADKMKGGSGDDTYLVDHAGDKVIENAGQGTDTVKSKVTFTLGTNVENLYLLGAAAINGTGNELANTIIGNAGNNIISGGSGGDTMVGGLGGDTYVVDDAGDVVVEAAGGGTDTVQSSLTYTLGAEVENLTLLGTAPIDGTGNTLANTITGNGQANALDGGIGIDTLIGGVGDDTYTVDDTADVVTEAAFEGFDDHVLSSATYTLGANIERLTLTGMAAIDGTGNADGNTITGNDAANKLQGGGGNDTINAGGGGDTLVISLAASAFDVDTLNGGSGANILSFELLTTQSVNFAIPTGGAGFLDLTPIGLADVNFSGITGVIGTELGDAISGGVGDGDVFGRGGGDQLSGGTGNGLVDGGDGDDILQGNDGNDTLEGGTGDDTYRVDQDVAGIYTKIFNGGADTDTLMFDQVPGLGTLTLSLGAAGSGSFSGHAIGIADVTFTSIENVWGRQFGVDIITGSDLANELYGDGNDDTLDGAGGNDRLRGDSGNDDLTGGGGDDTFVFYTGSSGIGSGNRDQILDFTQGQDKIDLSFYSTNGGPIAWYGGAAFPGFDPDGYTQARYVDIGAHIVIEIDIGGDLTVDEEIELTNSNVVLDLSDFILGLIA